MWLLIETSVPQPSIVLLMNWQLAYFREKEPRERIEERHTGRRYNLFVT
jgi:hypothetical protein